MIPSKKTRVAILSLALVTATIALAVWYWLPRPPAPAPLTPAAESDPRIRAASQWPNTHPEAAYVGDAVCAGCHAAMARTYREHPMGRSLVPNSGAKPNAAELSHAFQKGPFTYRVEQTGQGAFHREVLHDAQKQVVIETVEEVKFTVGSGRRGRSYLIDHDGFLFMSPITWYPQKKIWDLSPGYEHANLHFTRPVIPDCLFCHSNRANPVEHTNHRYHAPIFDGHSIGCERCHGPGQLHVDFRKKTQAVEGVDRTIVNPRHLEHSLREAVCQQCHLQGEERVLRKGRGVFDFRPGMPTGDFFIDFVKPEKFQSGKKFVGTVEQMYASRCYRDSTGEKKLGCISCHDPHATPAPERRVAFYREKCLNCHSEKGCSTPLAARTKQTGEDNCVACHMPPTGSEVNHTASSDHRVLRRRDSATAKPPPWPPTDEAPLAPFLPRSPFDKDAHRDMGIALIRLADRNPPGLAAELAKQALPMLNLALDFDGEDIPAIEARGDALWRVGRLEEALRVYRTVLFKAPGREYSLSRAAVLAQRLRGDDEALTFAKRAADLNPWRWQTHHDLAGIHAQRGEWTLAADACKQSLKIHAPGPSSRMLLISCYLQLRRPGEAETEFKTLLHTSPESQKGPLHAWFEKQRSAPPAKR